MWTSGNMDAENPDAEILMDTRSLHMAAAYCTIERSWVRYGPIQCTELFWTSNKPTLRKKF